MTARLRGAYPLFVALALVAESCATLAAQGPPDRPGPTRGAGVPEPPVVAQPKPSEQVLVEKAEGCGSVIGGDTARARDEAIIDAKVRALGQAVGTLIDSDTLVKNAILLDAIVRTRVEGYIKAFRILEEGPRSGDLYCVKIEAWVVPAALQDALPDIASEVSVLVEIPETNCGQPQAPRIVENQVLSKLVGAGYRVLDVRQLKDIHRRDLQLAIERGDQDAARRLRLQFLANLLVRGEARAAFSQNNQGIISARVQQETRAMLAETSQIIWNAPPDDTVGFGTVCDAAGRRGLQAAAAKTADGLLEALAQHLKRREREIEIRLRGVPDADTYRRLKSLVQGERWVSEIREGQFAPGESTLFVRYPEKTIYLATGLARKPEARLRLVEFGWSRIVFETAR